jgi:uncharacterized membrane protein YphA (DoxX/SURF4 family)
MRERIKSEKLLKGNKYAAFLFRLFLGATFIYASWHKLQDPAEFARVVYSYQMLPEIFVNIFAVILPWLELICGILILAGFFMRGSILIINVLLVTFLTAMTISLFKGLDIGCGCFSAGDINDKINTWYLLTDLLMVCIGFYVYFSRGAR